AALAALPVEALGLPPPDVEALLGLGLRRVADVLARPRTALSAALDGRLGTRLDALAGARPAALALELEPPRHLAERRLPGAVVDHHAAGRHVRRLAEAVERSLETRGLGARRLVLDLWGPEGTHRRVTVRTPRPLRRAADVARLFAHRLELLGEGAAGAEGVDHLRLHAVEVEPLGEATLDLERPQAEGGFEAFARFVTARYGEAALERVRADPATAKPEREARLRPWGAPWRKAGRDDPAPPPPAWGEAVTRPLRLLDPPEPVEVLAGVPDDPPATLVWRRVRRRVVRAAGPERFAPEWGREPASDAGRAGGRDYYRVEDEAGQRFWVFREGAPTDPQRRWFLHGLFA
ncbi:MAG: DNA polymerase Y family protein, partial [Caulobacteraceae bacterium]|nr:DNA polymerase Y family protein [Caulobacter sp.]